MSGINFDLRINENILRINSPRNRIRGPHSVIYKDLTERWALVTLTWDKKPSLGLRWFHGNAGNPVSRGHATWMIIPRDLNLAILKTLPIDKGELQDILNFLNKH